MDYQRLDNQLEKLYRVYTALGEDVEWKKEPAATEAEIAAAEAELGRRLPDSLRDFFLNDSKKCTFGMFFSDEFSDQFPEELDEIFSACFTVSLEELMETEAERKQWWLSDMEDEYDRICRNALAFMGVGNGDLIAFDLTQESSDPRVIYLSHEGDESHGMVLGSSFADYFEKLLKVGGCGPEDWQMEPFCHNRTDGIDPDCENARTYRRLIGLDWENT
ncbi:MAG: SMI1/KNR4 family protein [Butyricicoccaceae bacterium]